MISSAGIYHQLRKEKKKRQIQVHRDLDIDFAYIFLDRLQHTVEA